MQLNGFSGWISIDDNPVTEYAIEVDEARKTASCWIPSEVGKTFSVQWNNLSYNGTDTSARVSIDGTRCGRVVQRLERQHIPGAMYGVKQFEGGAKVRPFTFSTLATTDDDDALRLLLPDSISEHLGVIELSFIPIHVGEVVMDPSSARVKKYRLPDVVVHERSKKAVTQRVSLGNAAAAEVLPTAEVHELGPAVVTFRFKYRPLDVLQANGIAPIPTSSSSRLGATGKRKASDEPSANPSTAKRGKTVTSIKSEFDETAGSDDSKAKARDGVAAEDEEIRALKERLATLEAQRAARNISSLNGSGKVKEEERPSAIKIKREECGAPSRPRRDVKPAFVDLTLD
ncbi:hypothetical protein HMN09_00737400 [Mycena chlorophos]|uniref:DUF7918 domain-containing protein n=1 Tax=Mycena chlorophos TaxID=658473 RepID=A0A8H6W4V5_MYCCL|nr:hypothetical protein HMN09_00737400 [Mycena chlorophos]